ncbi:hypothetical protein NHX12_028528, partial [Muraenolepis orangiensis]
MEAAMFPGWTPLHEASAAGDQAVAEELLRAGADVNALGLGGRSPLHDALGAGSYQVVKLLLQYHANPNDQNAQRLSALDLAQDGNIRELLSTLPQPVVSPQVGSTVQGTRFIDFTALLMITNLGAQAMDRRHRRRSVKSCDGVPVTLEELENRLIEMSTWQTSLVEDTVYQRASSQACPRLTQPLAHMFQK